MGRNQVGLWALLALGGLGLVGGGAAYVLLADDSNRDPTPQVGVHLPGAGVNGQIQTFCSSCHVYPPPEIFPRTAWKEEIDRAYRFFAESGQTRTPPPLADTIHYYEEAAPLELPAAKFGTATTPLPVA
ncbi:MAG TPA: hypothetical protein VKE94_03575, partial [Gemmataceae bacterium]|nr:hypothetical protein [Gemmataceae bacterium]